MRSFTARWIDPNKGSPTDSAVPVLRAVCGRPDLAARWCSGMLGEMFIDLDDQVGERLANYPGGYYHRIAPRRYEVRFAAAGERRRAPGFLHDWDRDGPVGHAPWLPCVIVCPVCGRDNEVPLTGRSVAV